MATGRTVVRCRLSIRIHKTPNNSSTPKTKTRKQRKPRQTANTFALSNPIWQSQSTVSSNQLLNSGNPLPSEFRTRMRYSQTQVLTTQAGPLASFGTEFSLRLNSIFDPDFSLGGHQPYGYDQMAPFYARYLVTHAHVEMILSDPSADGLVLGAQVKVAQSTKTVANSSIDEIAERQGCMTKWVNDSGSQLVDWKFTIPLYQVLGFDSNAQYLADRLGSGALMGQDPNPVRQAYLSFALANSRGNGSSTAVVQVRISYDVILHSRVQMDQS